MDEVITNKHVRVLIPPDSGTRDTPRRGWTGGRYPCLDATRPGDRAGRSSCTANR
jgi:hypothetical protein